MLRGSGLPAGGSALAGAAIAAAGVVFAAVAAVTAQIAQSTRAATGLAAAVLAVGFLLRAAGDTLGDVSADGMSVTSAWPSWLSPLGWGQQTRPFHDDAWWLLSIPAGLSLAHCWVAYTLASHRDQGAGMPPVRRGPGTASRWLLSPLGLAWRLQRGVLVGWTIGVVLTGLVLGLVADAIEDMTGGNEQMLELLRNLGRSSGDLVDVYFAGMLGICAIAVAGYTVQALLRMRAEEASGYLEPVLATAVSRPRWMADHVLLAVAGSAALLALAGATTGLGYGMVTDDAGGKAARLTGAALAWLPAALALGGFVVAVFGLLPRLAGPLAWTALTACLLMGQVGVLLDLPQLVLDISPFSHVPPVPSVELDWLPLVSLSGTALLLGTAGLIAFRHRDLTN